MSRFLVLVWLGLAASSATAFDILQPLPQTPPIPADNPQNPAKIALGKHLYFDPRLSADGTSNCDACHQLAGGGEDKGVSQKRSLNKLKRSAPTLWNVAFQTVLFMDGRATSLELQAAEHLLDPAVMALATEETLVARLTSIKAYRELFISAFGDDAINLLRTTQALASFERTLLTPNSAFDKFIKGDKKALSTQQKRGLDLFDNLGCMSCHFGVNFAGPAPGPAIGMGEGFYELFPNHLGSEYDQKYALADDLGRYLVTQDPGHKYMWRVPILRNIALTAPYFHNGSVITLDEAVRIMAKTQLRLQLSDADTADIVAFLLSLTGERPQITLPQLPNTLGYTPLATRNR
ncbi:MAG: c-type cytochrome [Gammaproteobacteria bacterium]|nr:c-type cytochrome [Gammaproteobacteria bacterium]